MAYEISTRNAIIKSNLAYLETMDQAAYDKFFVTYCRGVSNEANYLQWLAQGSTLALHPNAPNFLGQIPDNLMSRYRDKKVFAQIISGRGPAVADLVRVLTSMYSGMVIEEAEYMIINQRGENEYLLPNNLVLSEELATNIVRPEQYPIRHVKILGANYVSPDGTMRLERKRKDFFRNVALNNEQLEILTKFLEDKNVEEAVKEYVQYYIRLVGKWTTPKLVDASSFLIDAEGNVVNVPRLSRVGAGDPSPKKGDPQHSDRQDRADA